jgi:hypothetical protein
MRDRAKEIFDFLVEFIARNCLPEAHNATGGIVLCSWSFANTYMTSLLANVASFSGSEVDLTKFIRRIVLFGTSQAVRMQYHDWILNGLDGKGALLTPRRSAIPLFGLSATA